MMWCTLTPTVDDMLSPYSVKHTPGLLWGLMLEQLRHVETERSQCLCHLFRIGVLCAYAANQNLSSQVKNIRRLVNSNMRDLHTFANDTPVVSYSITLLCVLWLQHNNIPCFKSKNWDFQIMCYQYKHDHYIVQQSYKLNSVIIPSIGQLLVRWLCERTATRYGKFS